jgi:hypothetical protein
VPQGRIRARPSCTVAHGPRAQCVRGPWPRGARPVFMALARLVCAACAWPTAMGGTAQLGLGATLSYGGNLTSAQEMAGKAWWGSLARGRRRDTTRRRRRRRDAASVDVGVGGFGHGGDGSDRATAASDSGGWDTARSGRRRERRGGASGCRAALSGRRRAVPTVHLTR